MREPWCGTSKGGWTNSAGSACYRFKSSRRCCWITSTGILNYCRTKVALGVVEAINGNIKTLLRRGRGYTNLRYLLLKAQRLVATKIEFVAYEKAA
jgi:transposase